MSALVGLTRCGMFARIVRKVCPEADVRRMLSRQAVIGLDLSLAGAGAAMLIDGRLYSATAWTGVKKLQQDYRTLLHWFKMKSNTEANRHHRLDLLTGWVANMVIVGHRMTGNVHVAIEGYAFSKHSRGISDLHELGGAIKSWLWSRGVPFRTYDPTSVKLAATGRGDAKKDKMLTSCAYHYEELWESGLGALAERDLEAAANIADACLIAKLLHTELELKAGRMRLDELRENVRRVLIRTTKSEPEALISRGFVERSEAAAPTPIFAKDFLA